jgi:predicted TIM-barrel fold metal-dependent hydrolase
VVGLHTGFGSPTIRRLFEGVPRPKPDPFPHIHPLTGGLQLVQHALACVIASTVLEDFPRLRWALLETGSEWVVPAIRAHSRRQGRDLSRYFQEGRMYVTCEPDEELGYVMNTLGEDCLVAASDMPHGDAFSHAQPAEEFAQRGDLSEQTLQKLLQDNARRLYGI